MGHLTRIINDLIKAKANGPNEDAITSLYNGEYFNSCLKFFSFLKFFRNVLCLTFALVFYKWEVNQIVGGSDFSSSFSSKIKQIWAT